MPAHVRQLRVARQEPAVRPQHLLDLGQRRVHLSLVDPRLDRDLAVPEQERVVGGQVEVELHPQPLGEPHDLRQRRDGRPHHREVHPYAHVELVPVREQPLQLRRGSCRTHPPCRGSGRAAPRSGPSTDMLKRPHAGVEHRGEPTVVEQDRVGVQVQGPDPGFPRVRHELGSVLAQQRLTAGEVRLQDAQRGDLVDHPAPLVAVQLAPGDRAPAGAADAPEVAVVGQEQLGDQRPYVQPGRQVLLDRQPGEEPGQPHLVADARHRQGPHDHPP